MRWSELIRYTLILELAARAQPSINHILCSDEFDITEGTLQVIAIKMPKLYPELREVVSVPAGTCAPISAWLKFLTLLRSHPEVRTF